MLLATSKILKNDSAIRLIKLEQNVKLNFVDHLVVDGQITLDEASYRKLIDSNNSHLFVVIDKQLVVGMLTLAIYQSPTGIKAMIEDVVVDIPHRGKGLGKRMIEHAILFAQSKGVERLMLTSRPSRLDANKLYQSMGFKQKETNVYVMNFIDSTV
jgi:ribosomal protein S18 acetylase RimI-like enzyme